MLLVSGWTLHVPTLFSQESRNCKLYGHFVYKKSILFIRQSSGLGSLGACAVGDPDIPVTFCHSLLKLKLVLTEYVFVQLFQVHYQGGSLGKRTGLPVPLAKSSPLNNEPIAEERWSGQVEVSPPHLNSHSKRIAG